VPAARKSALAAISMSVLTSLVVASSVAQAGPKPAVVVSGSVGNLQGGSALVVVQVGLPWGANNPRHIPAGFHYPEVAIQTITSRSFSIGVPDSATLRRAAKLGHGIVEFNVLVFSGSRFTSQMYPYTLTSAGANGNRQALVQRRAGWPIWANSAPSQVIPPQSAGSCCQRFAEDLGHAPVALPRRSVSLVRP